MENGRIKFEAMKKLKLENRELRNRLDASRALSKKLKLRLGRCQHRERWAAENANSLRFRISRAIESITAVRLGFHGGNKQPEHGFNVILGKCATCRGGGGRLICEDECEDLGLGYNEYVPKFHCTSQGREYWCEDCIGVGHTLSVLDYINKEY